MSKRYNHAFTLAFELVNGSKEGEITADEARQAIRDWLDKSNDTELLTNLGAPFDTMEQGT
tara:strand:+ start:537 stop:719 length:183 start_codon:yes stop_codon:yes gene_type:complete